ncbi:MAG: hypothetical protein ACM3OB_08590, partial [Acidobacteriota bacterium]
MRRTLLFAVAVLVLAAPISAESVQTFVGNTTGGPTWTRPDQGNPPVAGTHSGVHYAVQSFKLLAASSCYIVSAQSYDGFIVLYSGGFNPASPLTNAVSGDDDGVLGIGTSYIPNGGPSSPSTLSLAAGTYYLVTTSYSSSEFGAFQNTIHCQANSPVAIDTPVLVQGSCGFYIGRPLEDTVCLGNRFLVEIVDVT